MLSNRVVAFLGSPMQYGNGVPGLTDNRPVVPLMNRTFEQWWFHGYWNYPPPPDEIMQLPAGGTQTVELACNKVTPRPARY